MREHKHVPKPKTDMGHRETWGWQQCYFFFLTSPQNKASSFQWPTLFHLPFTTFPILGVKESPLGFWYFCPGFVLLCIYLKMNVDKFYLRMRCWFSVAKKKKNTNDKHKETNISVCWDGHTISVRGLYRHTDVASFHMANRIIIIISLHDHPWSLCSRVLQTWWQLTLVTTLKRGDFCRHPISEKTEALNDRPTPRGWWKAVSTAFLIKFWLVHYNTRPSGTSSLVILI